MDGVESLALLVTIKLILSTHSHKIVPAKKINQTTDKKNVQAHAKDKMKTNEVCQLSANFSKTFATGFYIGKCNVMRRLLFYVFYDFLLLFVSGDALSENLSMSIIAAAVSSSEIVLLFQSDRHWWC